MRWLMGPSGKYYADQDEVVLTEDAQEVNEEDIVRITAKKFNPTQKHMHSFFTTTQPINIIGAIFARLKNNGHAFTEPMNSYKIDCTIKRVSTDSESGEEEKSPASDHSQLYYEQCKM